MIGSKLSHYDILAELGRGGMGIVYRAQDTKLNREVAIKVLPSAALATDDDRARFYREAQAAAQLHHANIATIFEIDEGVPSDAPHGTQPSPFIAMELIDGQPLEEMTKQGPLKLNKAVQIASEIAGALELAHEKDIVHRDIKSSNVMVTTKNVAKVLDFGLAKTAQSTKLTRMGSTLGTASYMSPEQARGEEVDGRSDIWSLGVVLYELVSGRLPFAGEYDKAVMYGILNEDPPPLTSLRTGVPMGLEWIVTKMLAKKPEERYQSCADLLVDLKTVDLASQSMSRISTVAVPPDSRTTSATIEIPFLTWSWKTIVPVAFVLLFIGALVGSWTTRSVPSEPGVSQKFSIFPPDLVSSINLEVSKDGRFLLFTGMDSTRQGFKMYLYNLETAEMQVLTENMGDRYFISPDNSRIVYRHDGMIYTMPIFGGPSTPVAPFGSGWPAYLQDGSIVYDSNESLWLAPSDGSASRQISQVDSAASEGGHYNANPLPDGRHLLFHATKTDGSVRHIGLLDMKTGKHRLLGPGAAARYLDSGHILHVDGSGSASGQIIVRPFDADRLEWNGAAVLLEENGVVGNMTVDAAGTLYSVIDRIEDTSSSLTDYMILFSRDGGNETKLSPTGRLGYHRVSPDGTHLAFSSDADGDGIGDYVGVLGIESFAEMGLSTSGKANFTAWSSSGDFLYVEVDSRLQKHSFPDLRLVKEYDSEGLIASFDVSPDDSFAVYVNHSSAGWGELRMLNLHTGEDRLVDNDPFQNPRYSLDGRYLAVNLYSPFRVGIYSLEDEVFIPLNAPTPLTANAVWHPTGVLMYTANNGHIFMKQEVTTDPQFGVLGRPEQMGSNPEKAVFIDIAQESGETVLMFKDVRGWAGNDYSLGKEGSIDVVTNWLDVIKRVAPSVDN